MSAYGEPVSRSLPVIRHSVVGTRRTCDIVNSETLDSIQACGSFPEELTWLLTGLHWEGKVLLKKVRRKGLRECIHSAYERRQLIRRRWETLFRSGASGIQLPERIQAACDCMLWRTADTISMEWGTEVEAS